MQSAHVKSADTKSGRARNLRRLLKPRHVCIVGGQAMEDSIRRCADTGFAGEIWVVNPKRSELGGRKCYASIADLPEAPDATFIASISGPRDATARKRQTEGALAFAAQRAVTTTGIAQGGTTGSANTGTVSGATLFAGACASCHHSGGGLPISRPVALGLSTPVNEPDPTNFLRIVLDGIQPPLGHRGPIMPSFSGALTDPQIEALADYVRTQYSRGGRWTNVPAALAKMRQQQTPTMEAP